MTENGADVIFRHHVIDRTGRLEAARGFGLRNVPFLRDLRERFPTHLRMRRGPSNRDLDPFIDVIGIEGRRRSAIGIAIATHVLFLGGVIERLKHFAAAAPIVDASALQMRNHDGHARCAADLISLVHRLQHFLAFGAHVRGVDRTRFGERFGKLLNFFRRGGRGGAIGQAGA